MGLKSSESRRILRKFYHGRFVLDNIINAIENQDITTEEVPALVADINNCNSLRDQRREFVQKIHIWYEYCPPCDNIPLSNDIFFSFREKRFFNTFDISERGPLHFLYGGENLYESRTGFSGDGYILRGAMKYLKKMAGRKGELMSTIGGQEVGSYFFTFHENPLVMFCQDGKFYFIDNPETLTNFVKGEIPEVVFKTWSYKYLYGEFKVNWWSERGEENISDINLPYKFKFFVKIMCSQQIESLEHYLVLDSKDVLREPLGVDESGMIYGKLFHLPIKKVDLEARFQEGSFFEWPNGWISTKNCIFNISSNYIKIIYQGDISYLSEIFPKMSVMLNEEVWSLQLREKLSHQENEVKFSEIKNFLIKTIRKNFWIFEKELNFMEVFWGIIKNNPEMIFIDENGWLSGEKNVSWSFAELGNNKMFQSIFPIEKQTSDISQVKINFLNKVMEDYFVQEENEKALKEMAAQEAALEEAKKLSSKLKKIFAKIFLKFGK